MSLGAGEIGVKIEQLLTVLIVGERNGLGPDATVKH